MPEESHLEEMSAAIRAQRERQAVPRTMVDGTPTASADARPPESPRPQPPRRTGRGLVARLLGR